MREIKFRCWDSMSNYYFSPSSIDFEKGVVYETRGYDHTNKTRLHRQHILGKTCELEQFTGLFDKNGKDIYENDIVVWTCSDTATTGYVYSSREGYMLKDKRQGNVTKLWEASSIEVIGNARENKELLK